MGEEGVRNRGLFFHAKGICQCMQPLGFLTFHSIVKKAVGMDEASYIYLH